MTNYSKELGIINNSLKAIQDIVNLKINLEQEQLITKYNSILHAFELLKERLSECSIFQSSLQAIEKRHVEVINYIEQQNIEDAFTIIETYILVEYDDLKNIIKNEQSLINNGIDTSSNTFEKLKQNNYLTNLDSKLTEEMKTYWSTYYGDHCPIDFSLHHAYQELTGKNEPRLITQNVLNYSVVPYLNDLNIGRYYSDKNVYDLLVTSDSHPENVIKRIRGYYFDSNNDPISREDVFKLLLKTEQDLIIKRSLADDGKAVKKLHFNAFSFYLNNQKVLLKDIENQFGSNFIVQKVVKQHSKMAAPHRYSVNTFRIITLRWNQEIHYLLSYAKFGANQEPMDNSGEGGVLVGISKDGVFNNYGLDAKAKKHYTHPTTGFNFKDLESFPNFENFITLARQLHKRILHHNYILWDIAAGEDGEPIFIEMNFRGTVWRAQLVAQKPIFGELTEDILTELDQFHSEQSVNK
ncbi:hypothetical protein ABID56_001076 [Alkalibacillus flavidus]|uniref:Alpha-L-glutamate ligase-related protein ATP-grasp domain-containing protein n=1 Tax=Alkalibacillus flavidus TaxID=546021 RepID=A0ABV2KTS8_9BACI